MYYKNFKAGIEYKSNKDQLTISGYASVFNVVDSYNDIITSGAFSSAMDIPQKIKFLWQHECNKPIGVITHLIEDEKGLFMEAAINCNTAQGSEAAALLKQGALDGLSIGFSVNDSHFDANGSRIITDVKLWEISLVTFPANNLAAIESIKSNKVKEERGMGMNLIAEKVEERMMNLETKYNQFEAMIARPDIVGAQRDDRGFGRYIRSGVFDMEVKSLSSIDNESGGYTVTPELYKKIIGALITDSPMRRLASIETISTNALDILSENGDFATGWVSEGEKRDETGTAKISQKRILVHELFAQPKATQKLLDDSEINITEWLLSRLKDSFVRAENHSFIVGDGNGKPRGILSYTQDVLERINVEEEGVIKFDDILNLINSMPEGYISNASFLMHRSTLIALQKLKDADGRFIWQPSHAQGAPDTLLGVPVVCAADMPRFAPKGLCIALADFKEAYKIVDRADMTIMRDPFTEKPFVKFYTVKRVGGDVVNAAAIKLLKC